MTVPDAKMPGEGDREPVRIPRWLVVVGGVPLLAAMFIEFASVIGRNTGMTIPGTIELVQAAILLSSSTAIVVATLRRSHAKVRVLLSRTRGKSNRTLRILNAIGGTIFFLALTIGGGWIIAELWGASERSELLGVPWLPLRCYAAACMLVTATLYARRILTGLEKR